MKSAFIIFFCLLGWYLFVPSKPAIGTVVEKLHIPKHVVHKFDVAAGEFLCSEEPSNKVYLVDIHYQTISDQWVLKVAVTNTHGVRDEVYVKCPFETWRYSNSIGKLMTGYIIKEDIYW